MLFSRYVSDGLRKLQKVVISNVGNTCQKFLTDPERLKDVNLRKGLEGVSAEIILDKMVALIRLLHEKDMKNMENAEIIATFGNGHMYEFVLGFDQLLVFYDSCERKKYNQ
jgi:hypothetical protein